ncbi:MAG TPA: adenylate/guanylate cyclase domain-containing protein [Flavobacteriales bacterium]|nr:adenylate/guanylate cyclase domain-containing protein [Flavobacteriales bacterium]
MNSNNSIPAKASILVVLLITFVTAAHAQSPAQVRIDSLSTALEVAQEDTNKVNILNLLSEKAGWRVGDHDTCIVLALQAMELSKMLGFEKGVAQAHSNIGMAKWHQGELDAAMAEHVAALKIREHLGDKGGMAVSYGNIGHVYKNRGDIPEAIRHYELGLEMAETGGKRALMGTLYNHIGASYQNQGDFPGAMKSNIAALRIQEELGDSTGMTYSYNNIGSIHLKQKSYAEALTSCRSALSIAMRMGNISSVANTHIKLGNIHHAMGEPDAALENYRTALQLYEQKGDQKQVAACHGNIGIVYYEEGDLAQALKSQTLALGIFDRIGDRQGAVNTYGNLGSIELDRGHYPQALEWYREGLSGAEAIGSDYAAMQLSKGMMDAYVAMGDHRAALASYQQHIAYRDSLFNEENTKQITKLEMQYSFDKKEAATQAEQEKKDALAVKELQRQKLLRNGFLGGFALVGLFAGVFLVQRNKIGKEKRRSEELLLNILPEEVAEELKAKGEAEARHIDQVTVLFTDFKGFTAMSEVLTAKDLVRDLHECFSAFDRICERHGLEKIKTIGDAYMAAGGLPTPNSTHATDVIAAALEMRDFVAAGKARKMAEGSPYFEIRIGVHTGPVVAGIVGVKKFQYDIWGDTVNTASRMESSGEIGRVNISEATYALVKDPVVAGDSAQHVTRQHATSPAFTFTPRGKVQAKGKGEMHMYFVDRALPST